MNKQPAYYSAPTNDFGVLTLGAPVDGGFPSTIVGFTADFNGNSVRFVASLAPDTKADYNVRLVTNENASRVFPPPRNDTKALGTMPVLSFSDAGMLIQCSFTRSLLETGPAFSPPPPPEVEFELALARAA